MERVMQRGDGHGNGDDVDEPKLGPVVCSVWPQRLKEWSTHGLMDRWKDGLMSDRVRLSSTEWKKNLSLFIDSHLDFHSMKRRTPLSLDF